MSIVRYSVARLSHTRTRSAKIAVRSSARDNRATIPAYKSLYRVKSPMPISSSIWSSGSKPPATPVSS